MTDETQTNEEVAVSDIKEEKKEEETRETIESKQKAELEEEKGSPPPLKAMPPKPKDPQMPVPRPPSTTSVHSNASNGTPRTTTSRRGGRTRSRSPSAMSSRPGSTNANERECPETFSSPDPRGQSQSPANPSSAAAAAAAAAKAFSNSGARNQNQWYDGGPEGSSRREGRAEGATYQIYPASRGWPEDEGVDARRGYRREEISGRSYPPRDPYLSDRSGSSSQEGYHRYQLGTGYEDDGRANDGRSRSRPAQYDDHMHSQRYGRRREDDEYYRGPAGMGPAKSIEEAFSPRVKPRDESAPSTVKRSGGTTRVIGTATPIHVPRAADPPVSSRHHPPAGTPASVFRGRPGDELPSRAGEREDNTQKILMSLRTPTTSFEEQRGQAHGRKPSLDGRGAPPLSPEEPPQIQHALHKHQMDPALFFEQPSRGSPKNGPSVQAGTIETAPSFSLFNQSFDSLTDTNNFYTASGTLDFNSTSFGAGPTGSRDNQDPTQLLTSTSGAGSFAAGDRLLGTSSGGMFTFGMSPNNSFGNGPSNSSRRSGNMMLLGGPDQQPASPTQMLSMYPSYSGGYGSQGSGHGGHFRNRSGHGPEHNPMQSMSSGSFGGPAMYTRSYEVSSLGGYPNDGSRSQDGPPIFYAFLSRNKAAFVKCSFLLPGLKAALLESPISDSKKPGEDDKSSRKITLGGRRGRFVEPTPQDTAIAARRVISAICAFGGTITGDRGRSQQDKSKDSKSSIFREKDRGGTEPVTVTPSSSSGTPPGSRSQQPSAKAKYDEMLPSRYYENENRLSWEFEESPPVAPDEDDSKGDVMDSGEDSEKRESRKKEEGDRDNSGEDLKGNTSAEETAEKHDSSPGDDDDDDDDKKSDDDEDGAETDQPKMRYRCKLCGLPKQNHTCAYQQSLQRSIGIMVYPAVNAFTSSEPGMLAPALADMNNFVSLGIGDASSTETSPSRPTPDRSRRGGQSVSTPGSTAPNVTPETMRSATSAASSNSSAGQRTPLRTPNSSKRKSRGANMSGGAAMGQRVGTGSPPGSSSRKRTHVQMMNGGEEDLLFVDAMDLKPEQFRIVTPSKSPPGLDAFTYPSLPLPYAQRKRLSDNLFALSKEVPQLTDECAVVLREAREKDMWDLAVAELMTQVVVVIHCHENDTRFEGLRHYLLTLGIAC